MSVIYLIRHGQASFGQANYDRLSELGQRQARLTGEHLAQLGLNFAAAYCGSQARQADTAQNALAALPGSPALIRDPDLDEYDSAAIISALLPGMQADHPELAGQVAGMYSDRRAFQAVYESAMRRWITGEHAVGDAETWVRFQARAGRALARVRAENGRGRTVAVFSSGGPIAALVGLALGLEDAVALRLTWVIRNASISALFYDDERLTLTLFNSTAHLELAGEPGLITYR
ncbi:MAG: histidine phosphatase family protein [Pseudomonadota bacterium]